MSPQDRDSAPEKAREGGMNIPRATRAALLWVVGFVAGTAIAGGVALTLGSLVPAIPETMMPPAEELAGSPFASYLVPGLLVLVVVGGLHTLAFVLLVRRERRALLVTTISGYGLVIWILVQMVIISFSPLQVIYAAFGLLEIGLVLLALGVIPLPQSSAGPTADGTSRNRRQSVSS